MKPVSYRTVGRYRYPVILLGFGLLLGGCATPRETACELFEKNRKSTEYTTQYHVVEASSKTKTPAFKKLPKGTDAAIHMYTMRVDSPAIEPCHDLIIYKEFYLQKRYHKRKLILEEVREFYSAEGVLIASKTESIGDQFKGNGFYTGDTTLPIPEKAPPGKYLILSKITLREKKNSAPKMLANSSVYFHVIPRK